MDVAPDKLPASPGPAQQQAAPPPAPKRERPPRSPEELKAQQEKAATTRMLKQLSGARNVDELYSRVAELQGKKPPPKADAPLSTAPPSATPAPTTTRPGWPSDAAIAEAKKELLPYAYGLHAKFPESVRPVTQAVKVKKPALNPDGSPVTVDGAVKMVETVIVFDPSEKLADGCAPLVAKHVEAVSSSPERMAVLALITGVGLPLLNLGILTAAPALKKWWGERKAEKAKVKASPADQPATLVAPANGSPKVVQLPATGAKPS